MSNYTTKTEYRFYISNMQLWHETEDGDAGYQRPPAGSYSGEIVVKADEIPRVNTPEEYALIKAEYELRKSMGYESQFYGWYGICVATIREESEAEFLTRLGVPSLF